MAKIVQTWDEIPPVVFDQGEAFSTRALERKYRTMQEALEMIADLGLDAEQCQYEAIRALKTADIRK
jgi:hypothetical protein